MGEKRTGKVNPYQFTIRFLEAIPTHQKAAAFLNKCGRAKGQVIADAMELYFEHYGIKDADIFEEAKEEVHHRKQKTEVHPVMQNTVLPGYGHPEQMPQAYPLEQYPQNIQTYHQMYQNQYPQMQPTAMPEGQGMMYRTPVVQEPQQGFMYQQNMSPYQGMVQQPVMEQPIPSEQPVSAPAAASSELTEDEDLLLASASAFEDMDDDDF